MYVGASLWPTALGRRPHPPLDGIPGVWLALSLRRLLSTQTGPVIRVRRDSDNAEMNFGFTADGWLDTAALLAWCGSASGYVTTWWDAKGGTYINATASAQPKIVNTGVMYTAPNGRPRIRFDYQKTLSRVGMVRNAGPLYALFTLSSTGSNAFNFLTHASGVPGNLGNFLIAICADGGWATWGPFLGCGNGLQSTAEATPGPYVHGPLIINVVWAQITLCLDAADPMIRRNKTRLTSTTVKPGVSGAFTGVVSISANVGESGEIIVLQDAAGVSAVEADQHKQWVA